MKAIRGHLEGKGVKALADLVPGLAFFGNSFRYQPIGDVAVRTQQKLPKSMTHAVAHLPLTSTK